MNPHLQRLQPCPFEKPRALFGSLARGIAGRNAGENRVRMAGVAQLGQCVEAARRIAHPLDSR